MKLYKKRSTVFAKTPTNRNTKDTTPSTEFVRGAVHINPHVL